MFTAISLYSFQLFPASGVFLSSIQTCAVTAVPLLKVLRFVWTQVILGHQTACWKVRYY